MRSSSNFSRSPSKKVDGFVLGPILYPDNTGDAVTTRSSRVNSSFSHYSPTPAMGNLSFQSPSNSVKSKKSINKKRRETSKSSKSKNRRKCEYSDEECPIRREQMDAKFLKDTKSEYEKRKRAQMIELAKRAEKDHDNLLTQRTSAQRTAKDIEVSVRMEEESRDRSIAMMKTQIDGMDWRSGRDLKDLRREIEEWREKTAMSGDLANRVDAVEKRVNVLEKADLERKKSIEMTEKNSVEFGRMKTQSMALEITQIKNRRGAEHLRRMPKEVAESTSKNLYKLCADLHRLTFHLNQKNDITRLVDEALTLAEAIAPLYGPKEEFIDSRENTSCTNVSIGKSVPSADSSTASFSGGSAPPSPLSAIRSSLRRVGSNPADVSIPPLSQYTQRYSSHEKVLVDAPSLREKSSNYYSDKEFMNLSKDKETHANCEPGFSKESATPPPSEQSQPVAAAVAAESTPAVAAVAAVPSDPSPASVSISKDSSGRDPLVKQKKHSRSYLEDNKSAKEETKP